MMQGLGVVAFLAWRMWAVSRGQNVTSETGVARVAQITLLAGMLLGWLHVGINNGWFGIARLVVEDYRAAPPDWVDDTLAVNIIKGLVIVAGPIHVWTFTQWKWGWRPVAVWSLFTVALPFALTV